MEPLHYPAVAIVISDLPPMETASADRQMCVAEGGLVAADGDGEPQASEQAGLAGNLLATGVWIEDFLYDFRCTWSRMN